MVSFIVWIYNNLIVSLVGLALGMCLWSFFTILNLTHFSTITICVFAIIGGLISQLSLREKI